MSLRKRSHNSMEFFKRAARYGFPRIFLRGSINANAIQNYSSKKKKTFKLKLKFWQIGTSAQKASISSLVPYGAGPEVISSTMRPLFWEQPVTLQSAGIFAVCDRTHPPSSTPHPPLHHVHRSGLFSCWYLFFQLKSLNVRC